jgi:hypothetical protein
VVVVGDSSTLLGSGCAGVDEYKKSLRSAKVLS